MKKVLLTLLLSLLYLHAGYTLKAGKRARSTIDRLPFHTVADMKRVPQKTSYYANKKSMTKPITNVILHHGE